MADKLVTMTLTTAMVQTPIQLQTRDGDFLADKEIPPFNPLPEIVLWGARVFAKQPATVEDGARQVYREGLVWAIVEPRETQPQPAPVTDADGKPAECAACGQPALAGCGNKDCPFV